MMSPLPLLCLVVVMGATTFVSAQSPESNTYLSTMTFQFVHDNSMVPMDKPLNPSITNYYYTYLPYAGGFEIRVLATPASTLSTVTAQLNNDPFQPLSHIHYVSSGYTSSIGVKVTAKDGSERTYHMMFYRQKASTDCSLQSLSVNVGTLTPTFVKTTNSYRVTVPYDVTSLVISPVLAPLATFAYTSSGAYPYTLSLPTPGVYPHTIYVQAEDYMISCSYRLDVTRSSTILNLEGLTLQQKNGVAPLSPTFTSQTTTYSATALYRQSLLVKCTKNNPSQTIHVSINGAAYTPVGSLDAIAVSIVSGANTLRVRVTGADATSKIYTVNVNGI